MMNDAVRAHYFFTLCKRVAVPHDIDANVLLTALFLKEFVWFIGNDDNRIEDARDVKRQYLKSRFGSYSKKNDEPVSVLEVLIGVSERLSFLIDVPAPECAWMLIKNLQLDKHRNDIHKIDVILDGLIWRTYRYDGSGGFFPLRHPSKDQSNVEIWYQMSEWIEENYSSHDI